VDFIYARSGVAFLESTPCAPARAARRSPCRADLQYLKSKCRSHDSAQGFCFLCLITVKSRGRAGCVAGSYACFLSIWAIMKREMPTSSNDMLTINWKNI